MFLMQIHNFVRFCELVVKSCPKLESITLTTGEGDVRIYALHSAYKYMTLHIAYIYNTTHCLYTVCALIFAGFIFHGFAIFAFFAFLNSRLLGAVVLKHSRVKYSRIYGLSPYAIIVYGCRSAKLAVLVVGFV